MFMSPYLHPCVVSYNPNPTALSHCHTEGKPSALDKSNGVWFFQQILQPGQITTWFGAFCNLCPAEGPVKHVCRISALQIHFTFIKAAFHWISYKSGCFTSTSLSRWPCSEPVPFSLPSPRVLRASLLCMYKLTLRSRLVNLPSEITKTAHAGNTGELGRSCLQGSVFSD